MFRKYRLGIGMLVLLSAFSETTTPHIDPETPKTNCFGYSIIEFGKGIDCRGDTIQLIKRRGLQVFIAEFKNKPKEIAK